MIDGLLRELAPQVLAALTRRYGGFDLCEDAVQEALLAAATQWPEEGLPDNPKAWLITVAARRRTEIWRSETARQKREEAAALATPEPPETSAVDDSLNVLMMCCHPELTTSSQVALTLRAVGGLTTAEIGRAFGVPEATIAQRISRAKAKLKGASFSLPEVVDPTGVLHVLYLIFNEGYTASSGPSLQRVDLSAEAIRLTRQVRERLPDNGEVAGLLALMLLTDARRPARTDAEGNLVPLTEQDRGKWDGALIAEGSELITRTLKTSTPGPYQLQAAIAALHDEAARAEDTDWVQILGLYELLATIAPGPMVALNRVVAYAEVRGPEAGLRALGELAGGHRVDAVRAHLLERAGETSAAIEAYRLAARATLSVAEQRYLQARASRLEITDR
ncbi:sigma-70 family RNA polymerase sigma factor [Kribbella sp. NBC_01245]|uniref:RNA polymerase sigma factor n=1 Tax=Kribbella sp. NBC_01245 TaxID=2903578 RepID=UPI002E2E2A5E|nr:sigma-70 family RNA polymerase sigma factor [Kribbella sp. NBC_01245]